MGAGSTFDLNGANQTIAALSGSGNVALGNGSLTVQNVTASTFAGTISGSGSIVENGQSSTVLANASSYTGSTTVSGGTLTLEDPMAIASSSSVSIGSGGELNGGTIAAPYLLSGNVNVAVGGTLGGDGSLTGTVSNAGTIAPGNSPGILTVNNYVAVSGAQAVMQVDLSASSPVPGVTNDFLQILQTASGATTGVQIAKLNSQPGIATKGNGIELIQTPNNTSSAAFQLSSPVADGGYEYFLKYVPGTAPDSSGFYLQSGLREEVYGTAAIDDSFRTLERTCVSSVGHFLEAAPQDHSVHSWADFHAGTANSDPNSGLDASQKFYCGTGGTDAALRSSFLGRQSTIRLGVAGLFGSTNIDLQTPAGRAGLTGNGGLAEATAYYGSRHLFVELRAGYAKMDWKFSGPDFGDKTASSEGVVGSANTGLRFSGRQYQADFMIGVDYDGAKCSASCLLSGLEQKMRPWTANASVRLATKLFNGFLRPYVLASYANTIGSHDRVFIDSANLSTNTADELLTGGAGLEFVVAPRTRISLGGTVSKSFQYGVRENVANLSITHSW